MLYSYLIEKVLGFKDVNVTKFENIHREKHIYLTMKQRIHICPECGCPTSKIHDYRTQLVKDLPSGGCIVILHIRKRRHICPSCGKKFYEDIDFLPKYKRFTNRVFLSLMDSFRECRSIKDIARAHNMAPQTASQVLNTVKHHPVKLPEVLSIDEFRGNADGERFQCILTDLKSRKLFDVLPTRTQEELIGYFSQFRDRSNVKYIVMDMSGSYRPTMRLMFPKATIIIDRYHYLRQIDFALEKIRISEQKRLGKDWRLYFKRSRKLLLKDPAKLKSDEYSRVQTMFEYSPKLKAAYELKREFQRFRNCEKRAEAAKILQSWFLQVHMSQLPEFTAVAQTFANWSKEILNSVELPYTNGFTEGCNNRIKVLKRISFGMPRFKRFRQRILCIMLNEA